MDQVIPIKDVIALYKRVASLYEMYSLQERDFCKLVKTHNIHERLEALRSYIYRDGLSERIKRTIREELTDISVILQEFNLYYIGKACENQVLVQCKSFKEHTAKVCSNNNICAEHEIPKIFKSLDKYGCAPVEGSVEATVQKYPTFTQDEVNALAEDLQV